MTHKVELMHKSNLFSQWMPKKKFSLHVHWNEVPLFESLQMPLFKQGPLLQGLKSFWQAVPVLNRLHWHINCWSELRMHIPWLEQLAKHDDKSPV